MTAITTTAGTNTALTWSTSRWIGAFFACADSTSRTMRDSVVSAPMASVRTTSRPSPLTAPPVTRCPGSRATGRLSPVSSDSSTWLAPSSTSPSTGMRSPGRTTTRSPTRSRPSGRSASVPSGPITWADAGVSACSARMASTVRCLARDSSHLPSITSVTTTAALSKYRCGIPEVSLSSSHTDSA